MNAGGSQPEGGTHVQHAGGWRWGMAIIALACIGTGCSGPTAPSTTNQPAPPAPTTPLPPATTSCSFAIPDEHRQREVAAAGAVFSVPITTESGCAWSVGVNAPFVTVNPASGTGSGTVEVTISSNPGTARAGDLSVAGHTITLQQSPPAPVVPGCSFVVTPERLSVSATGVTTGVDVVAGSTCEWEASAGDSFVTTDASRRAGNGRAQIVVAPNPGRARTGSLTVAGRLITVAQDAAPACVTGVSLSPTDYAAAGGPGRLTVSAPAECDWEVQSGSSFVTLNGAATGSGGGVVDVTVAANTSADARTATLTVGGRSAAVTQAGATGTPAPTLPPSTPPSIPEPPTPPPSTPPPATPPPPTGPPLPAPGPGTVSLFTFTSMPGDPVGEGHSGTYSAPATPLTVDPWSSSNHRSITLVIGTGGASWRVWFLAPPGDTLRPGTYANAVRASLDSSSPGLSITSPARGCNESSGAFAVHALERSASGVVLRFHATFVQVCDTGTAALTGEVVYVAPTVSVPPPQLSAATSGFRFESEPGDWVGAGGTGLFTPSNATFNGSATQNGRRVDITVRTPANGLWSVNMSAAAGQVLAPGVYSDATTSGIIGGTNVGLTVGGDSRGCNLATGAFTIHSIEFGPQQTLRRIHASFEQRCAGSLSALRGELVLLLPPMAAPAPTPAPTSSFLSFSSEPGDYIGGGQTRQWTAASATFVVRDLIYGVEVDVTPAGDASPQWNLGIAFDGGPPQLGLYEVAGAYLFVRSGGTFSLSAAGRSCGADSVTTFQVHSLARQGGAVTRLQVTFEQRCHSIQSPSLRGELVYIAP